MESNGLETMRRYATLWEAGDVDGLVRLCHLPYFVLRSGHPTLRSSPEEVREAFRSLLPLWTKDGGADDRLEALPGLSPGPTTIVVRARWGAWTLRVSGQEPQRSPEFLYVVCRRRGKWGVSGAIAEWPGSED